MSVNGTAHVRVYGAELAGAEANNEGSLHTSEGSTLELYDTTIKNATALGIAGGIGVSGSATLNMVRSKITRCIATKGVGGLLVSGKSVATLTDCTLSDNRAGSRTNSVQGLPSGEAGGIAAQDNAHLTLQDTLVTENEAGAYGGGMVIRDKAQMLLQGNTTITRNNAWERAGGVNMVSNGLLGSFDNLARATYNNSAPHDPDIGLAIDKLQVLGASSGSGNSTTEKFIPGDVLVLAVSIAGFNGTRSNQLVTATLFDAQKVSKFTSDLQVNSTSRQQANTTARVMIRQPPGAAFTLPGPGARRSGRKGYWPN